MLNDRTTLLSHLMTRRSGRPRELGEPGPSVDDLRAMVAIATRTPDHGKLAPWRFVIVPQEKRAALATLLTDAYRAEKPDAGKLELAAMEQFANQAPALVVLISCPVLGSKIPVWEQELSAGAAAMNLLHAAHALGYAGGWLTGWPAFNDQVRDAFADAPARIAGFMFIGTPVAGLEERPRPELDAVLTIWQG